MEETCARKYLSVTAHTASNMRRDVIGRYCGPGVEQHLKAILLSCSVSVFGSIAAFAGTADPSHDNAAATTQWTGPAANQTVDECLAWDIACRLEQPVGAGPGGPWAGLGGRDHEGGGGGSDDGGSDDGGSDGGGSDGGGSDGGGSDGGGSDDGGSDHGGGDEGGSDDGGRDNKGLGNGDENDDSSDNGSGNTDDDNPGKGGGGNRGNGGNGQSGSER